MNKDSLTHKVKQIAGCTGLPFNTVLTYFFLETVLRKLLYTTQAKHFIFKGGLLIANTLGLARRSTVDIDILVDGINLDEVQVRDIARQLSEAVVQPEVRCTLQSIEPIRQEDDYGGFRAKVLCQLENIQQIIPLDFATGDPVTPSKVEMEYRCVFTNESLPIPSYNYETIIAEKLETIMRRGLANSRSKDFFDIHIIWTLRKSILSHSTLAQAVINTFNYRHRTLSFQDFKGQLAELSSDDLMLRRWSAWQKHNTYAQDIRWEDALDSIQNMLLWLETASQAG